MLRAALDVVLCKRIEGSAAVSARQCWAGGGHGRGRAGAGQDRAGQGVRQIDRPLQYMMLICQQKRLFGNTATFLDAVLSVSVMLYSESNDWFTNWLK